MQELYHIEPQSSAGGFGGTPRSPRPAVQGSSSTNRPVVTLLPWSLCLVPMDVERSFWVSRFANVYHYLDALAAFFSIVNTLRIGRVCKALANSSRVNEDQSHDHNTLPKQLFFPYFLLAVCTLTVVCVQPAHYQRHRTAYTGISRVLRLIGAVHFACHPDTLQFALAHLDTAMAGNTSTLRVLLVWNGGYFCLVHGLVALLPFRWAAALQLVQVAMMHAMLHRRVTKRLLQHAGWVAAPRWCEPLEQLLSAVVAAGMGGVPPFFTMRMCGPSGEELLLFLLYGLGLLLPLILIYVSEFSAKCCYVRSMRTPACLPLDSWGTAAAFLGTLSLAMVAVVFAAVSRVEDAPL